MTGVASSQPLINCSPCRAIFRHDRKGTAAVEFAVVLPLFLLLVIGSIDVGRAIMVKHKLTLAARAGCRLYVVKDELTEADVHAMIDTVMADAKLQGYAVELSPPNSKSIEQLEPVSVTISIPHDQVSWLRTSWFLSGETLSGTCVMPGDTGKVTADGSGSGGGASSGDTGESNVNGAEPKGRSKASRDDDDQERGRRKAWQWW